ncbi:MAG TPA: phosphatase PAP2 family protein [Tepidisphaeraceae bacterium]|nr:phosphatase PAP2 family protein [Tepidisphaeraceae bacterium]
MTSKRRPGTWRPLVTKRHKWIVALAWLTLIAAAACVDRPVSSWVGATGLNITLKSHWSWLLWSVRRFGDFRSYTLVAGIVILVAGRKKLAAALGNALFVLLGGALSGLNAPVKWIVGRHRPFHGFGAFQFMPCAGPLKGLIGMESGLSFPSGDVCLAAATSTCLAILFPRWRWFWVCVVLLVALERVAEGAHYPSDVAAGALLGWLLGLLANRWTEKWRGKRI